MTDVIIPNDSPVAEPGAGLRISDEQRRMAAADLTAHCVAGRLTVEELDERMAGVWAARYSAELHVLFHDLPTVTEPEAEAEAASWRGWLNDGKALLLSLPQRRLLMYISLMLLVFALLGVGAHAFEHGFGEHGGPGEH